MSNQPRAPVQAAAGAKLMVAFIGLVWGFHWIAARIIVTVLLPCTRRALRIGFGTTTLFAAEALTGVPLCAARGERLTAIVGFFNVTIFDACSTYA